MFHAPEKLQRKLQYAGGHEACGEEHAEWKSPDKIWVISICRYEICDYQCYGVDDGDSDIPRHDELAVVVFHLCFCRSLRWHLMFVVIEFHFILETTQLFEGDHVQSEICKSRPDRKVF